MGIVYLVVAVLMAAASTIAPAGPAEAATGPVFVTGSDVAPCARCHSAATRAWQGSHHAGSMQHANPDAVLGVFDSQVLAHAGERTLFTRRGEKFLVTLSASGSDAAAEEFEVLYTFGLAPLQQYLVEIEPGRLQALPWAWDTRPGSGGGQRWLHLYEGDRVPPGDRLHWQEPLQNWNGMCADCHSTGLTRNYNASSNRFETSADTVNISCASCHGDASDHLRAMETGIKTGSFEPGAFEDVIRFIDSRASRFERGEGEPVATNLGASHTGREIEVCASCHSRRTPLTSKIDPARAFLDQFTPELLRQGLYYPDGQIQGEVYVWGSFMQSKMAAAGVTCTHCHDAHGLGLKRKGNALCTACHAPNVFDANTHHKHLPTSQGAACVSCHMPETTYMSIDARRDHGFTVPRPDLSVTLNTPNACTGCHTDMKNQTAAAHITRWHGPERPESTAQTISAARARDPAVRMTLAALINDDTRPAILRATALSLVPNIADRALISLAVKSLGDDEPLIRMAAIRALTNLPPPDRARHLAPRLADDLAAIRLEAALALQDVPVTMFSKQDQDLARTTRVELLAVNTQVAWRGEGRLARALSHQGQGNLAKAISSYEQAISIDPGYAPPYVNLAELIRRDGREGEATALLREGLERTQHDPALEHALGLALVRGGTPHSAMIHLERAAKRASHNPRFAWVYAVALHSAGKGIEARAHLKTARARHPFDPDLLTLALSFASEDEDTNTVARHARELAEIFPDDRYWQDLIRRLEQD